MRGKEAARNARRREADMRAELDRVRAERAREGSQYGAEVQSLKTEVARLRGEIMQEAARLAEKHTEERLAKIAEERRQRGISDEMTLIFIEQKDKFIRDACRYISMTTGIDPLGALEIVWTWITGKDMCEFTGVPDLLAYGIAPDGWVALVLRKFRFSLRTEKNHAQILRRNGDTREPAAFSLDHAEQEPDHFSIHPRYERWKRFYRPPTEEEITSLLRAFHEERRP